MTRFQITQWDESHENNKSRLYNKCNRAFFPSRMEGLGFLRLMAEPDGAAIYGIFHMMLAVCTQQNKPRAGWLTEDGTAAGAPITAEDMALRVRRNVAEVQRTLDVLSSEKIGWLLRHESDTNSADDVAAPFQCPSDAPSVPGECADGAANDESHRRAQAQCPPSARAVPVQCQKPDKERRKEGRKEPSPKKTGEDEKPNKQPASKTPGNTWSLWIDLHRERGLADPFPEGPDTTASARLGKYIADPAELRRILNAYLDDSDQWILTKGHALRHLPGRVNAYRNGANDEDEFGAMAERIGAKLRAEHANK